MFSILSRRCPLLATSLSVLFCLLSMLISDSRFDLVWFRLSCDHGWIRSGSVNVRKQQQQQQQLEPDSKPNIHLRWYSDANEYLPQKGAVNGFVSLLEIYEAHEERHSCFQPNFLQPANHKKYHVRGRAIRSKPTLLLR